jgi:hypothetical protein
LKTISGVVVGNHRGGGRSKEMLEVETSLEAVSGGRKRRGGAGDERVKSSNRVEGTIGDVTRIGV